MSTGCGKNQAQGRKRVRQAVANLDPQKELEDLRAELRQFEQQFGMSSAQPPTLNQVLMEIIYEQGVT